MLNSGRGAVSLNNLQIEESVAARSKPIKSISNNIAILPTNIQIVPLWTDKYFQNTFTLKEQNVDKTKKEIRNTKELRKWKEKSYSCVCKISKEE